MFFFFKRQYYRRYNKYLQGTVCNVYNNFFSLFLKKIQKQNEILLFQQEEGRQPTITSTKYVDGNFDFLVCLFFIV
jgi:hypothetical protein